MPFAIMSSAPRPIPSRLAGFTIVELVMVLIVVSVLALYAVPSVNAPASLTVHQQADALVRDLRHTQQLATAWRKRLRLVADGSSTYVVSCVGDTNAPCSAVAGGPVTDPATGEPFSVTTQSGVTIAAATAEFTSFGRPIAAASFGLSGGGDSATVTVNAVGGFVSAAP